VIAARVITGGPASARSRSVLVLLAVSVGLMMIGYGIAMLVFAKRLAEFGPGLAALGFMTMGFAAAQFFLSPVMGSVADRIGRGLWSWSRWRGWSSATSATWWPHRRPATSPRGCSRGHHGGASSGRDRDRRRLGPRAAAGPGDRDHDGGLRRRIHFRASDRRCAL
jgi:hypothetical protein